MSQQQDTAKELVLSTQQTMPRESLSLYFHVPFCRVRCAYCDFNTYAGLENLIPAYAQALAREVRLVGGTNPTNCGPAHTIFFGGGTPSLMPLRHYVEIFQALHDSFALTDDCEVTLEANPGTVDAGYLAGLRALGVNRLSYGVQSSHAWELRLLDRLHTFDDVIAAVGLARAAGFDSGSHGLNLDLIFALPHQTLAMWQTSVLRALALEPDHLSLYALSLEQGTPLRSWVTRGLLPLPDPDLAADMYLWASDTLAAHGFEQYEISNWARADVRYRKSEVGNGLAPQSHLSPPTSHLYHACLHNLQYWRNLPYLGFGAGAHGCAAGWRYSNVLAPAAFIERLIPDNAVAEPGHAFPFSPAIVDKTAVSPETAMDETMMLGLRLVAEGVREATFRSRFSQGLEARYGRRLKRLQTLGLLDRDADGVRLTQGGRLLGNRVFREFV